MNWVVLKALHEVYLCGETPKKESLLKDNKIAFLLRQTRELKEGIKVIYKGAGFEAYYEKNHLENFLRYEKFLLARGLMRPQLRFEEEDIVVLIDLQTGMQTGALTVIRDKIIEAEETVRGVSEMFFKNEKHLQKSKLLVDAVKAILEIAVLANEKDQQYIYILKAFDPCCIVLCENIDFLKRPTRPRAHHIELWYAGGYNVSKLDYMVDIGLPIFYSCDWDYDGLRIYEIVKEKIPAIQLLYPNGAAKGIIKSEHKSLWRDSARPELLSGLNANLFSVDQQVLIHRLITTNQWITEESNELISMVDLASKRS